MTLRLRLLAIIGIAFAALWVAASLWMLRDLRTEFRDTLDERLAASARMVANLIGQMPEPPKAASDVATAVDTAVRDGVACEIRMLHGDLVARTQNSPQGLGSSGTGFGIRTIQGEQWRSYTLEQGGLRITTADRLDRREALLRDVILAMAIPFLIAMAGSLLALWFGIRKGLAPLESIRAALGERTPDALHPLPEERVPGEIEPLVHTINVLLERTQSALERERRFTGDAAHELRTPLTAIKTHIQVARLSKADEKDAALASAEASVWRLQHTLEQLLTLARVEGRFSFDNGEQATVSGVVALAGVELSDEARGRIRNEGADSQAKVAAPPILAAMALRNLLENALRHSPQDSPVTLRVDETADSATFSVLDEGASMSDEERAQATRRFWRKGTGQGSGLGLSIVAAICQRYGGEFSLHARPKGGTEARLTLPTLRSDVRAPA